VSQGWDYVIVGAGSAGATLAARLSENPSTRVLLLEAGPDFRTADTPKGFRTRTIDMQLESNPEFWWKDLTARRNPTQEPYPYLQGRGTGGSSTVNGICSIRGIPDDYDGWARLGAKGWSFAETLPYFVKLEDEHDYPDAPYHGSGGPIPIYREPQTGWSGLDHAFRETTLDLGFPWCDDHNAPDATGVCAFAMNIRAGIRVSTNDAYLEPARDRPNLTIRGGCHAARLRFAPGAGRVVGVQLTDGSVADVEPGGEVIVACGASHSPALLMRSGIGPADELRALGIEVAHDLPVGASLQDHPMLMLPIRTPDEAKFAVDGRVTNCVLRYSSGLAGAGENDIMLLPNIGSAAVGHSWMIIQLEQVFSRGRLSLVSADPTVDPLIEQCILTDPRDVVRMEHALDQVAELLAHPALGRVLSEPPELPDKAELPKLTGDTVHLCGTCRMGSPAEETSVVDPDCRVLGVEGLRVIDASVMPTVPRANINLSVIMIAERMAERMAAV
jgi:choline dehydrogenase-like flavoprotein